MAAPIGSGDVPASSCELEASVVTGFENTARDEVREKLGMRSSSGRGRINFKIPVTEANEVLRLSSIDNVVVVMQRFTNFHFADTAEECLIQLRELVSKVNWDLGIKVWAEFFTFHLPISPLPQDTPANKEPPAAQDDTPAEGEKPQADADVVINDELVADENTKSPPNPNMPNFRVTCYRSGTIGGTKHPFQSPAAACEFGGSVQEYFGWNVNLTKYDLEVVLNIDGSDVYVALGLTRQSLHRRNLTHFGPTTLRPTIAYNMLRMCDIQKGDVVCDPMCGGGTIPIEAAINWPDSRHLCGDNFDAAPQRTQANLDAVNESRSVQDKSAIDLDICQWDSTQLPLSNSSVDVFVTDLPFGKRSGTKQANWRLYPATLQELGRCTRVGGRACLLTQDKKCMLKVLPSVTGLWRRSATISINIGGLAACVFLLHRTARQYLTPDQRQQQQARQRKPQSSPAEGASASAPPVQESPTPEPPAQTSPAPASQDSAPSQS